MELEKIEKSKFLNFVKKYSPREGNVPINNNRKILIRLHASIAKSKILPIRLD